MAKSRIVYAVDIDATGDVVGIDDDAESRGVDNRVFPICANQGDVTFIDYNNLVVGSVRHLDRVSLACGRNCGAE